MPYKSRRYERADYFSDLMLFALCRLYRSRTDFLAEEKEKKKERDKLPHGPNEFPQDQFIHQIIKE